MQPNHHRDKTDSAYSLYNDYEGLYQDDDAEYDLQTDVQRLDDGREVTIYRTDTFARLESEPSKSRNNDYDEPSFNHHHRQSVSELESEEEKSDGEHVVDFVDAQLYGDEEEYEEEYEQECENPEDITFNGYGGDEEMYGGNQFDEQGLMNQVYDDMESDVSVPMEMTGIDPVYQAMANFQTLESQNPEQNDERKSHARLENICYFRRETMDLDQELVLDPEQDFTSPNGPPPPPTRFPWNQNKRHPKEHHSNPDSPDTLDDLADIPHIGHDVNPIMSRFMDLDDDNEHDREILMYHKRQPLNDASSPHTTTQRSDPTTSRVVGRRRGLPPPEKRHQRMMSDPLRSPTATPNLEPKYLSVPAKSNKKNPKDKVAAAGSPPNRSSTKSSKSSKTAKIKRELNLSRSLNSLKSLGTLKDEPTATFKEIPVNMSSNKKAGNLANIDDLDAVWTKARNDQRHRRQTSNIVFPPEKNKHRKHGSQHFDAMPTFRRQQLWIDIDAEHTEMFSEIEPSDMVEDQFFSPSKIKPLNMKKHVIETKKRDDGHRLGKYHPVITQPSEHNDKSVIFMRESLRAFGLFLAFPWCLLFMGYIPCYCCQRQFRIFWGGSVIFNCYVLTAAHQYFFESFELWYIMPWVYGILFFVFMMAPYFKMRRLSRTQLAYVFSLYVGQVDPSTSYWLIPLFCSMCAILAYGFATIIFEEKETFFIKCGSMFGFASLVYGTAFTITKWIAITDEKMLLRVEPSPLRASEIQNVLDKQLKDYDAELKEMRSTAKQLHKEIQKHNRAIGGNTYRLTREREDVETQRRDLEELRTQMEPLLNIPDIPDIPRYEPNAGSTSMQKKGDHRVNFSQTFTTSRHQWDPTSSTEDDGDFTEEHDEFQIRRDRNENGSFIIDPDDNNFEINEKDDGFESNVSRSRFLS